SLVFDYVHGCLYANPSPRTDPALVEEVSDLFGFEREVFAATDARGRDIYHTNVVMSVGERFAVVAAAAIEAGARRRVLERLEATGRDVIAIDRAQMSDFAGNILELRNRSGEGVIVMSSRARDAFRADQRAVLERH